METTEIPVCVSLSGSLRWLLVLARKERYTGIMLSRFPLLNTVVIRCLGQVLQPGKEFSNRNLFRTSRRINVRNYRNHRQGWS